MNILIRETTNRKFGDYQFDMCLQISQKLLENGIKKSPKEVAIDIVGHLPKISLVEKVKIE